MPVLMESPLTSSKKILSAIFHQEIGPHPKFQLPCSMTLESLEGLSLDWFTGKLKPEPPMILMDFI